MTCAAAGAPAAEPASPGEEEVDEEAERQEREAYGLRHWIAHRRNEPARLFALVEQDGFLARQAERLGGFQQPSEDVEKYLLPAAIAVRDWTRFVRFSAVAANLRAVAEDLAEPRILGALASAGRVPLARDLAARLPLPLRQAEARAAIAGGCGRSVAAFGELLREIARDLQSDPAAGEAEPRAMLRSLVAIARRLGPDLDTLWEPCVERLVQAAEDQALVWQAVAAAWLERGDGRAPGLWRALSKVGDPRLVLAIAPSRLAELEPDDPRQVLARLRDLLREDDGARRLAFAAFLGSLSRTRPGAALAAWESWTTSEDIPWTVDLVEAGRELIVKLGPDRLEGLCSGIEDRSVRVALRVVDLEARPDERRAAAALAALAEMPGDRLHFSLRCVAAEPPGREVETRRRLRAIAAYLYEMRYTAAAGDLRRFVDLLACLLPDELKAHFEGLAWSPSCTPEALRMLAGETRSDAVARIVIANAERYAAAVSAGDAQGFLLRKDLLILAAGRLCCLQGSTKHLAGVCARLLPEEEDDLRAQLAPLLHSREVAAGIRDRRRQLLAQLEAVPAGNPDDDLLTPRSLYAAVARIDLLEDEIRGLSPLLESPLDLVELAANRLGPIGDPGIRLQALLRLAWHSLAFQEAFYGGRPDRAAAIEMIRSTFTADSDAALAAFTPQLAELGARVQGAGAVAELQEAVRRLVRLDSVAWPDRLQALERLLAGIPRVFRAPGGRGGERQAGEVLEGLARLPLKLEGDVARQEVRGHWHEVMPIAAAALDRLPEDVACRVRPVLRQGLVGVRSPVRQACCELCCMAPMPRLQAIDRRLEEAPALEREEVHALAYLLAVAAPDRVRDVLGRLPADAERDDLALRLVRNGWLPPEVGRSLKAVFSAPAALRRAEAWLADDGGGWCRAFAELAARGEIDPAAPGDDPLIRRLWRHAGPGDLEVLAQSVLGALRSGGWRRGQVALRLWFHARLAPRPGAVSQESQRVASELSVALRGTLELSNREPSSAGQ